MTLTVTLEKIKLIRLLIYIRYQDCETLIQNMFYTSYYYVTKNLLHSNIKETLFKKIKTTLNSGSKIIKNKQTQMQY